MIDSMGVLVVEDDPDIRYLLRVLIDLDPSLRLAGEASTIGDAIAQARCLEPALVVLDLGLDGHDTLGSIPALRRASPASRIVVYTAQPTEIRDAVLAAGAAAFVSKGALPQMLIDELHRHANHAHDDEAPHG